MDTVKKTHRLDQGTAQELREIAGANMTENKAVIMVINQHQIMKSKIRRLESQLNKSEQELETVQTELGTIKKTWKKLFKLIK